VSNLTILAISDIHSAPKRNQIPGPELVTRAISDALRLSQPDIIVLLGDLLENGSDFTSLETLQLIKEAAAAASLPVLSVHGNHDCDQAKMDEVFKTPPGIYEICEHRFVVFGDKYHADGRSQRRPAGQKLLQQACSGDLPVIALQHVALLPIIEDEYPYNILEATSLAREYSGLGVSLSLSGHYHSGELLASEGPLNMLTVPALGEWPFKYSIITLENGRFANVRHQALAPDDFSEICDAHMHTEFAHCCSGTSITGALQRLDALRIPTFGILEHADQLYFPAEGFWTRQDSNSLEVMQEMTDQGFSRHPAFRKAIAPLRKRNIPTALECEPASGSQGLAVLPQDRKNYDYLLGGLHFINRCHEADLSQVEAESRFMLRSKQLICDGIQVLAHPLRYFGWTGKKVNPELFGPLVELLAANNVAAEINFHKNIPDPEFFNLCLKKKVKISLGTDAHSLPAVGTLKPHIDFLKEIQAWSKLDQVLWKPQVSH
jgi:histidinol phosphatase-like PHP family hydrolase/predicted phosphodiesterase